MEEGSSVALCLAGASLSHIPPVTESTGIAVPTSHTLLAEAVNLVSGVSALQRELGGLTTQVTRFFQQSQT
jgi:hypothetical protein